VVAREGRGSLTKTKGVAPPAVGGNGFDFPGKSNEESNWAVGDSKGGGLRGARREGLWVEGDQLENQKWETRERSVTELPQVAR